MTDDGPHPVCCTIVVLIAAVMIFGLILALKDLGGSETYEYSFHHDNIVLTFEDPNDVSCIGGGRLGHLDWVVHNGSATIKFEASNSIVMQFEANGSGEMDINCVEYAVIWFEGVKEVQRLV